MNRNSRSNVKPGVFKPGGGSGFSRNRSSIPKYLLNPESAAKKPRKLSSDNLSTARKSVDRIARVSLASGKATPNRAFTPINNRVPFPSTSAVSSNRQSIETVKSSFGGKSKKCMWPLSDPSFKAKCIENIWEFLQSNKYDHPVTIQTLRSPTAKDFSSIFTFIYRYMDSTYRPSAHIEDDIPKLLKGVAYPFQMPRSSFLNVASPHTWPSILAMLSWLVNSILLFNGSDINECMFPDDPDSSDNYKVLQNDYLTECYKYQDVNYRPTLIEEYKSALRTHNEVLPENFHHIQREEEKLLTDLENFPSLGKEIEKLSIEQSHLNDDNEKLVKFNEDFKAHSNLKMKDNVALERELEFSQQTLEKHYAKNEELKQMKNDQNLTSAEINLFRNHSQHLLVLAERLEKEEQETNQQIYEEEMSISKMDRALRGEACDCNLKLSNLGIECEELGISHIEDQIPHWESYFIHFVKAQKKEFHNQRLKTEREIAENFEEAEKLKKQVHTIEKEVQKKSAKASLLETEIGNIKQTMENEEKQLQRKCDELNDQIELSQKENRGLESKHKDLNQRLQDLKKELEVKQQEYEAEKSKAYARMMQQQEVVNDYCLKRQHFVDTINRKLQEEAQQWTKDLERFDAEA